MTNSNSNTSDTQAPVTSPVTINDNSYLAERLNEAFDQFAARLIEHHWLVAAKIDLGTGHDLTWTKAQNKWVLAVIPKGGEGEACELAEANKAIRILAAGKLSNLMQAIKDAQVREAKLINEAIRTVSEVTSTVT